MQAESQAALVLEHESAQTMRYLHGQARNARPHIARLLAWGC